MIPSLLKRHFIKRHLLHVHPLVLGACLILLELLIGKRRKITIYIYLQSVYALPPIFTSQTAENRTGSLREVPVVWKGYRIHGSKSARHEVEKVYRGQRLRCLV